MRKLTYTLVFLVALVTASNAPAEDWSQVAANAARNGHVADQPLTPFSQLWDKTWQHEIILNTAQPIIIDGTVYVATQSGKVRSIDAATGNEGWIADANTIFYGGLAGDRFRIYAAGLNGTVYAFNRSDGLPAWPEPANVADRGFTAAPLLMNGKLYIGNRNGNMYCIDAVTGLPIWWVDTGAPIQQTAAGADGKIVFTNEDMNVFCLNAETAANEWAGPVKIAGGFVGNFWPVIHNGKVIIRTMIHPMDVSHRPWNLQNRMVPAANSQEAVIAEQTHVRSYYQQFPEVQTFHVLNLADGSEPYKPGIYSEAVNSGITPPPTMGGDGYLYAPYRTSAGPGEDHVQGAGDDGIINISRAIVGRFNSETGLAELPIIARHNAVTGPNPPNNILDIPTATWEITTDETVSLTSGGNLVVGIRNSSGAGAVSIDGSIRTGIPGKNLPRANDMQDPVQHIAISERFFVWIKFNTVLCAAGPDYIAVEPPHEPPTAAFTADKYFGKTPLTVNFDAGGSTAGDSPIASYNWDFGDSNSAAGVTTSNTYTADGAYTVTLVVTDEDGYTGQATAEITVGNRLPTASFTADPNSGQAPLTVSFDASDSNDPDGTITGYDWDFGDGMTGTGPIATHTFTDVNTYTVTLVVTDDEAATDSTQQQITVQPIIIDVNNFSFETQIGDPYNVTGGGVSQYSISRIPGWTGIGADIDIHVDKGGSGGSDGPAAFAGGRDGGSVYQILNKQIIAGERYLLTFGGQNVWQGIEFDAMFVYEDAGPVETGARMTAVVGSGENKGPWMTFTLDFEATAGQSYIGKNIGIMFTAPDSPTDQGWVLVDNIRLNLSPAEEPPACELTADFDGSFKVDYVDLKRLADKWLWSGSPAGIAQDIIADGIVNEGDFALLANEWLSECPDALQETIQYLSELIEGYPNYYVGPADPNFDPSLDVSGWQWGVPDGWLGPEDVAYMIEISRN